MSAPGDRRPDAPVLSAALADVTRAFAAVEVRLAPEDLLDAAWLARWLPEPTRPVEPAPEPARPAPAPAAGASEPAPERDPPTVEPNALSPSEPAPAGDAVGLTLPRAGAGAAPGRHFRAPAAPALPRPRELGRALRPLARRVPSRVATVLDIAETVRRFADSRVCDPARLPARERWLTIGLVTDTGFGADLWADTAREFRALLGTLGAFRDVRDWALDTDGPPRLFAGPRPVGPARDLRELIDPAGRTLVVVLSPCVTAAWHDGTAPRALELWARHGPVLLVPLLPENLWGRTALAAATLVRAAAPAPGAAGSRLRTEVPGAWPDDPPPAGVPVPVAALTPVSLRRWAGLVAARPGALAPALVLGAPGALVAGAEAAADVPGAERVARFRREASPLARRLAGLLAAAPVLNLPIVRLIRRSMLAAADQPHEAEVLFGGLLARAPGADAESRFEFRPGVRAALLDAAPTDESLAVLACVSEYLGEHLATGATFASVFADPSAAAGVLAPDESPFAQVAAEVLVRAGGDYARMVRRAPLRGPGVPAGREPGGAAAVTAPHTSRAPEPDDYPLGYESAPDPDEHRFRRAAALVIGIGRYAHPELLPIPTACADAVEVANRLGDPSAGRFFPHSITVLTDEVATRAAIDRHLWHWLAQEAHGAELVVLYFTGYSANGYLLPHDADPHSLFASAIPIGYLAECVNRLGCRATVVCLDCHSDPKRVNRSTQWTRRYLGRPAEGPLRPRYVLASGEDEQPLLPATDGGPHSLFAWHLLRGIAGAGDRDGDGLVGAAELCEYVSSAVARDARARGTEQTPWFVALSAGNDVISTVSPGTEADPHTLAPAAPAEYWDELPNKPEEPAPVPFEADPATAPQAGDVPEEFVPHEFGPYFLLGRLGVGGMGAVYRARPHAGGPEVALKTLHRRLTASPSALRRFAREYEVLRRLRHPGVVSVLSFARHDGVSCFTMELVPGKTLDAVPPRSRTEAVRLVRCVAKAMEHVHAAGIVHRDLKLSNVIVRPDGFPVLVDFGVAQTGDEEDDEESGGAPVGTPAYMSPEQLIRGPSAASPLSDVYALGAGLYKLLTGRLPFQGALPELISQITQGLITPPAELVPDLDPRLSAVVLRALARLPEDRFPSMAALAEALAEVSPANAVPESPARVGERGADPATVAPEDRFARLPCDFGPYRLLELLWMGERGRFLVFGGRDDVHDRFVRVTVLREPADSERRRVFRDEARVLRRLSDLTLRCAPRLFDAGAIDGCEFFTTERLNGQRLDEYWAEHGDRLGLGGLAALVARVAREMGAVHRAFAPDVLIHRNLNPRNILVLRNEADEPPRLVILGFGLAIVLRADGSDASGYTGGAVGAFGYMPPEQLVPGWSVALAPLADVFSLGAVLYKLLTGQLPYTGENAAELARAVQTEQYVQPSAFDPRFVVFDPVCRTALAKRPEDRYATMDEFAGALTEIVVAGLYQPDAPAPNAPAAGPTSPPPFDREDVGDVTVVRLVDERLIDEARVQVVGDALLGLVDRPGRKVVLNLSRLVLVTAAILGRLVRLNQQLRAEHGAFVICNAPKDVLDLLQITKLSKTFTFAEDEEAAVQLLDSK